MKPLQETLPEPWLRGPIEGVHPFTAPVLYAFQQAREDLARYTAELTHEQLWARPHGFGSVGFHIRHIAGSTLRLMAYLQGQSLTPQQLAALANEHDPGMDRANCWPNLNRPCAMPRPSYGASTPPALPSRAMSAESDCPQPS